MARQGKSAGERRHHGRVAEQHCLACAAWPVNVHHVVGYADRAGRLTKCHRLVVPLCEYHHDVQHGPKVSVHAIGHRGFYQEHGIDLYAEAQRLEAESVALGILPAIEKEAA